MIDVEPLIVRGLDALVPEVAAASDWTDVLRRSHIGHTRVLRGPRQRGTLLVVAVASVAALAAGLAIAATHGAFDGISTAERARTPTDKLDAKTLSSLRRNCPGSGHARFYVPLCHLVLGSTRLIGVFPATGNVYVVADTRGDLCTLWGAKAGSCGPPLSKSHPISFGSFNRTPTTGGTFIATGLAIDGVTSVSFRVWIKDVTAPVKNNVWIYTRPRSTAKEATCIRAHFADGATVNPFPGSPCSRG